MTSITAQEVTVYTISSDPQERTFHTYEEAAQAEHELILERASLIYPREYGHILQRCFELVREGSYLRRTTMLQRFIAFKASS